MSGRELLLVLVPAVTLFGGLGCSHPRRPDVSAAAMADSLAWNTASGAQRYVVRGWSGDRLLFEVTTADTLLVLTPSMSRAVAAFDTATAEILAQKGERVLARSWRQLRPRNGRAVDGAGGGT